MSTWTIKEANTDKELGTIENKLRFVGSQMTANGAFGHYIIEGNFGNRSFQIKKDGEKVSVIEKQKRFEEYHLCSLDGSNRKEDLPFT